MERAGLLELVEVLGHEFKRLGMDHHLEALSTTST
jgi:hypothetical protein